MNILIACEFSGIVREAFKKKGHNVISCDLLPTEIPGNHYQGDVRDILQKHWDLVIAHPPCFRLTNAVWWYIIKNNLYHEVKEAAKFFNLFLESNAKSVCNENPIMNSEARIYIRKPDQIIQPYNFGEDASKQTCLWLKNLPLLQNTTYFEPKIINGKKRWGNQTINGWNKVSPGPERWKERSRTYKGIAEAMAEQWG